VHSASIIIAAIFACNGVLWRLCVGHLRVRRLPDGPVCEPANSRHLFVWQRTLAVSFKRQEHCNTVKPTPDPALAGNPFIGEPLDAMCGQLMLAHVLIDSALSPSAGAPRHK